MMRLAVVRRAFALAIAAAASPITVHANAHESARREIAYAPATYAQTGSGQGGPGYTSPAYAAPAPGYYEPPPPPQKPDAGFEMPAFSVRIDPLNWLLEGRLGFELEVQLWKFITFEAVPIFVVNDAPPTLNLRGHEDNLTQHSNGLGALAGTSLGVGFWLDGKPFDGHVLRFIFTNYGYEYRSEAAGHTIDSVTHTDRQIYGFFGSYARWGFFTIGGGIGLGVELNKQQRCFTNTNSRTVTTQGCDNELQIALDKPVTTTFDLNGPLFPVQLMGRLSLGAVF